MTAHKSGGCFPGSSLVRIPDGQSKRMDQLQVGDRVAAFHQSNGEIVYSEVIAFLDRLTSEKHQFVQLITDSGNTIKLTPTHLVPVQGKSIEFASRVQVGDRVLVKHEFTSANEVSRSEEQLKAEEENLAVRWAMVVEVSLVLEEGAYAPLTYEGTVLVNDVVASCYAVLSNHQLAHYAFLPLRLLVTVQTELRLLANKFTRTGSSSSRVINRIHRATPSTMYTSTTNMRNVSDGIHWYASLLQHISFVLPSSMFFHWN